MGSRNFSLPTQAIQGQNPAPQTSMPNQPIPAQPSIGGSGIALGNALSSMPQSGGLVAHDMAPSADRFARPMPMNPASTMQTSAPSQQNAIGQIAPSGNANPMQSNVPMNHGSAPMAPSTATQSADMQQAMQMQQGIRNYGQSINRPIAPAQVSPQMPQGRMIQSVQQIGQPMPMNARSLFNRYRSR